jgi:DUF1365 family protein
LLTNSRAFGTVWHKRYTPKIHKFDYTLDSWLIDIDNPKALDNISHWVSYGGFNLYSFDPSKYLRSYSGSLSQKVRKKFVELGSKLDGSEQIFLLGQLKNCGLYFSPINLFMCFMNNKCCYIMAEVSNTPWNERHYYLIDMADKEYVVAKNFHVSPFWNINQDYHWKFDISEQQMYFQIDNYQDDKKVFSAGYSLNFMPFSDVEHNNQIILKQPFSVFKIIGAIYYEALKIFLKGISFVSYQKARIE